jgi:hypothetical protein
MLHWAAYSRRACLNSHDNDLVSFGGTGPNEFDVEHAIAAYFRERIAHGMLALSSPLLIFMSAY